MIDTMLATWGLSLALIGAVTMLFGNSVSGFSAPLGNFAVGALPCSRLRFVPDRWPPLCCRPASGRCCASPRAGLIARGTMQNPEMAAALGVAPDRVYAVDLRRRRRAVGAGRRR